MKHIPYSRQSIDEPDIVAAAAVLRSDWITQGPQVKAFEDALCEKTGAKYAVAVSSGTAALHLAVLAAGVKNGDEVITSPVTFVATANAVLYCDGKPVFADIQTDTINIDPIEIAKKITDSTKAVIPVHFAGHPADLEEIGLIARKNKLIVIEDAAHALGALYKNTYIGSCKYSDMTILSFHPVKHITTGEGGAVTTNDRVLYDKLLVLRSHGIIKDKERMKRWDGPWYYEQQFLGFNYRITDIQCSLGRSQLNKLSSFVKKRNELADYYDDRLSGLTDLILPYDREYVLSSKHLYYIRLKDSSRRLDVFESLRGAGIGVQVHYIPVHLQPYYSDRFGYSEGDYPNAESYYLSTISIPLYPDMTLDDASLVVAELRKLFI